MSEMITPANAEQLAEIIEHVKTWPLSMRIAPAKQIPDTLDVPSAVPATRGRPVEELIGIGAGASVPPYDDQVRSWMDEHRLAKFG